MKERKRSSKTPEAFSSPSGFSPSGKMRRESVRRKKEQQVLLFLFSFFTQTIRQTNKTWSEGESLISSLDPARNLILILYFLAQASHQEEDLVRAIEHANEPIPPSFLSAVIVNERERERVKYPSALVHLGRRLCCSKSPSTVILWMGLLTK